MSNILDTLKNAETQVRWRANAIADIVKTASHEIEVKYQKDKNCTTIPEIFPYSCRTRTGHVELHNVTEYDYSTSPPTDISKDVRLTIHEESDPYEDFSTEQYSLTIPKDLALSGTDAQLYAFMLDHFDNASKRSIKMGEESLYMDLFKMDKSKIKAFLDNIPDDFDTGDTVGTEYKARIDFLKKHSIL